MANAGPPSVVGIVNSVTAPAVVILPFLLAVYSVNHNAPSGPLVIANGWLLIGNSVITPPVVARRILLASFSVNQSAPSDPVAPAELVGIGKPVNVCARAPNG